MSKVALNLFPARVSIGTVQPDGTVLMTLEFSRALSGVFDRIGGADGMSADDLALLASSGPQPDLEARSAAADALAAPAIDQSALVAALIGKVAALQEQASQFEGVRAELAKLARRLGGVEQLATFRDPYRVNWERPGRIGYFNANTGAFTALKAITFNKITITEPASGATLALADGAALTVPAPGGTLGSAAYKNVASDWAIQQFGCNGKSPQAAAASGGTLAGVISALVANGILSS
jgi:hypothetical protein